MIAPRRAIQTEIGAPFKRFFNWILRKSGGAGGLEREKIFDAFVTTKKNGIGGRSAFHCRVFTAFSDISERQPAPQAICRV
jgi:hypothetical protein